MHYAGTQDSFTNTLRVYVLHVHYTKWSAVEHLMHPWLYATLSMFHERHCLLTITFRQTDPQRLAFSFVHYALKVKLQGYTNSLSVKLCVMLLYCSYLVTKPSLITASTYLIH